MIKSTTDGTAPTFPMLYSMGSSVILIVTGYNDDRNKRELVGTVVLSNGIWKIGEHAFTWNADEFKPYHGSVTLRNA